MTAAALVIVYIFIKFYLWRERQTDKTNSRAKAPSVFDYLWHVSYEGVGTQVLELASAVTQVHEQQSSVGSGVSGTRTSTLIQLVDVSHCSLT